MATTARAVISYASTEDIPRMEPFSANVQQDILVPIAILVVMLLPAPASAFVKQSTFNVVIYNVFTDFWGKAGFNHFKESVKNHLKTYNYNQYNLGVYKEGASSNDEYPVQYVGESSEDTFLTNLQNEVPVYPSVYGCMNLPFYKPMYNLLTKLGLRDTAVTVVTQFPPADDDLYRDKLQELATAFNIRINVVWISDETFIRCFLEKKTNPQYDKLKKLAFTTGGLFVPQKYAPGDAPQFTDVVISSHYQYQPLAFGTAKDCTDQITVSWQTSLTGTFVVTEGEVIASYGCTLQPFNGSLANGQLMFTVTNSTNNECSLTLSNPNAACSARVFASDTDNSGLRLYSSFVEDVVIDSSKYQPTTGNPFYFVLHAEKNGMTVKNIQITKTVLFMGEKVNKEMDMVSRSSPAVFDMISKEPITCSSEGPDLLWAEVYLNVSVGSRTTTEFRSEKRYIVFKCYDGYIQSTTTTASSTSTRITTTSASASTFSAAPTSPSNAPNDSKPTSTVSSTSTSTSTAPATSTSTSNVATNSASSNADVPNNFPVDNPITFAYGFANTIPKPLYEIFAVTTLNTVMNYFGYFGVVRFEVLNGTNIAYHPEKDIASFQSAVYNQFGYGTVPGTPPSSDSQVLQALKSVANSDKVYENSLIVFCLDKLPRSPQYNQFATLVNKNVKTIFLMDKELLRRELGFKRTAAPLNEIAAATNGHLIISDQTNTTDFQNLMNLLYSNGPSQSLLFARSMKYQTTSTDLGILDVNEKLQVTITATTSVYEAPDLRDFNIKVTFKSSTNQIVASLNHPNNSNFFTDTVTLEPDQFNVIVDMTYALGKDVHLRMWIPRTDRHLKVQYADLDMKPHPMGPDTVNGAAARVTVFGGAPGANLSIDIRDCEGAAVKLYDANQWQQVTNTGDAFFVPFFCVANSSTTGQCAAGTQNKYHVQYTSSDGLSEMRSFLCSQSSFGNAANCLQKNSRGDFECSEESSPFYRGPTGKLRDCSDRGHLVYDNLGGSYVCQCDPGFTGESCETGICPQSNTSTDGVDVQYRSYTVVIGVDWFNYGLESVLLEDASNIVSLKSEPPTIWRYQLIVYCDNKKALPVYIGGSFDEFNKEMKSDLGGLFCSATTVQEDPFDLTDVFQAAVSGLGRLVRGIIVFYTEKQTSMQVDLERFISISRNYRQELYLVAMDPNGVDSLPYDDFKDLRAATFSTGGNILFMDGNPTTPQFSAFSDMISSVTSLALLTPSQVGNTPVTVESGATGYVFLSYRDVSSVKVASDDGNMLAPVTVIGRFSAVYKLKGAKKYVISGFNSNDYSASAVILNGLTPSFTIINERTDDEWTAFASPDSVAGPSIALTLPPGWHAPRDNTLMYRVSARPTCNFGYTAFSVFPPMSPGANIVTISLSDGTTTVNRVIPVGVTSQMVCQNGGKASPTMCSCPSDFTTPDCSRPICQQGELNTWGDACACDWNSAGGRLCKWKSSAR
nr:Protein C49C3.4 [Haemonchus contortus]